MKIGIIQNAPRTADLSNNLRHIVQGYRSCLDHGADIVVASAHALCGPGLYDLAARDSFRHQMQLALQTLSRELGEAPLILGAYSSPEDELEDTSNDSPLPPPQLTPYLLENDVVEELENEEIWEWEGRRILATTQDAPLYPDAEECDVILHLATSPWHTNLIRQEEYSRQCEALNNESVVVYAASVGTAEGLLYGGGSGIYSPTGKTLLRLPWFEPENRVANVAAPYREATVPQESEAAILTHALLQGIRDTVRQYGYGGVCVPLDLPHSALLATLATEALGSANVEGVTFCGGDAIAKALGISCRSFDIAPMLASACDQMGNEETHTLCARLQAAMLSTHSESRGLLLLSPLSQRDVMLGQFTLYGESCGMLAPLANLYEMDLHMLQLEFKEKQRDIFGTPAAPQAPQKDIIIHALADCNVSAGRFIRENNFGLEENEVRQVQRRIITSAIKRMQLPFSLRFSAPEENPRIPCAHRLND